jgi:hypothetical protein
MKKPKNALNLEARVTWAIDKLHKLERNVRCDVSALIAIRKALEGMK